MLPPERNMRWVILPAVFFPKSTLVSTPHDAGLLSPTQISTSKLVPAWSHLRSCHTFLSSSVIFVFIRQFHHARQAFQTSTIFLHCILAGSEVVSIFSSSRISHCLRVRCLRLAGFRILGEMWTNDQPRGNGWFSGASVTNLVGMSFLPEKSGNLSDTRSVRKQSAA